MSRFWSSFATATVGAALFAGSAVAGGYVGYAPPSQPAAPAPAPTTVAASYTYNPAPAPAPVYAPAPAPASVVYNPAPAPVYAPAPSYATLPPPRPLPAPAPCGFGGGFGPNCGGAAWTPPAPGPNCGPGFGPGFGGPGFGWGGFPPPPPPPVCTTTIKWETTYRTEQRCEESWREVSIPVSVASSLPGACGPNQVCKPDVYRIKGPHCEPRMVTVPVSKPVRVTTCEQPDANSCGVVGQPLEDRRWGHGHHGWDKGGWDRRDDRWDDRKGWKDSRPDWRPAPAPIYNPAPFYGAPVYETGSIFAPSYAGPATNYRAARASLTAETGEGDAVADDVEIVQAAPAPAAGGTTWLTEPAQ